MVIFLQVHRARLPQGSFQQAGAVIYTKHPSKDSHINKEQSVPAAAQQFQRAAGLANSPQCLASTYQPCSVLSWG